MDVEKSSPFEVPTALPVSKISLSNTEITSEKKQTQPCAKNNFNLSLSRSLDTLNRVRLFADSKGDTKAKAKKDPINFYQMQSKSFIHQKEQIKAKKSVSFAQRESKRLQNARYSHQPDSNMASKTERKDKSQELYDRLMGPKAGSYGDLENQINGLMKLRREDRIGELEFERKIKKIKFEALQRDSEIYREANKNCAKNRNESTNLQKKAERKPILKKKGVPTSKIELNGQSSKASAKNSHSKEESKDLQSKIQILEKFDNQNNEEITIADLTKAEPVINTERDESLSQSKSRDREAGHNEVESEEHNKLVDGALITNSRSSQDITKLVQLDLNNQIKRRHQIEIGCSEMLKNIQKQVDEERFERMTKPDENDTKQISHRKFDYKFFMNCKVIQERQKVRDSQMN